MGVDRSELGLAEVEQALRARTERRVDEPDCPELEDLALVVSGLASEAQRVQAARHLESCPLCAQASLELAGLQARGLVPPIRISEPKRRVETQLPRAWLWRMGAGLATAAVLVLLAVAFWPRDLSGPGPGADEMVLKGGQDDLFVAVQRGARRFQLKDGDRLEVGDRLGLFYSAATAVHLAVFALDAEGGLSLICPARGRTSTAVTSGQKRPLPDGAVVQSGRGCEWLIAVFTDQAQDIVELHDVILENRRVGPGCRLDLDLPEARAVRILSVQR